MSAPHADPATPADAWSSLLNALTVASPLPFDLNTRRCLRLDLGGSSATMRGVDPADTPAFTASVQAQIAAAGADYAGGGYAEDRALYRLSAVFGDADREEPRTLHLGVDLWLPAGTPVHAVLGGTVHSFQDNAHFGDYGPTLILQHEYAGQRFHTLYGHLARRTLAQITVGQPVATGERLGWLGEPSENMGWPPHLHFQIIGDLGGRSGDYPGVCKPSEAAHWLANCPDPNFLLRIEALS